MIKKSRLLVAPAAALALATSSLTVPTASAATVTINGEQCTITPHQATVDRILTEAAEADLTAIHFDTEPIQETKTRAEGWSKSAMGYINVDARSEQDFDMALHAQIIAKLRAGDLEGARTATRNAIIEALPNALTDESQEEIELQLENVKNAPNVYLDVILYPMWFYDACSQGKEMNQNYHDLKPTSDTPDGSLDFGDLGSDEGSLEGMFTSDDPDSGNIGRILGTILGLGAIGALIGGIAFWMQQQGLIR